MKIKKVILTKAVTIYGRNVWGFNSHITFEPSVVSGTGWWFYDPITDTEIKIDRHSVLGGMGNLFIKHGKTALHVLEHLVSMKWYGLDGVRISGSSWGPYFTAKEFLDKLRAENALLETEEYVKSFAIDGEYCFKDNKETRASKIEPSSSGPRTVDSFQEIEIRVHVDYPKIGASFKEYSQNDFHAALSTYPQGYPYYRYYVALFLSWLGWPNLNRVAWLQKLGKEETLQIFSLHRLSDILGALAIISHEGLPTNFCFTSCCSGHYYDLKVLQKIP